MNAKLKSFLDTLSERDDLKVEAKADLKKFSTIKLTGIAPVVIIKSVEAASFFIKEANKEAIPFHIIGLGSNQLLESTENFIYCKFFVPRSEMPEYSESQEFFSFSASTPITKITKMAVTHGLKGWEVFTGVPASLGGAIAMNAGTNLGEIGDLVKSVTLIDSNGEVLEKELSSHDFSYRKNLFLKKGELIVEAKLKNLGTDPEIPKKIEDYMELRNKTQPLWERNCGCTFKNYEKEGVRFPAGKYIDLIGLKGFSLNNVKISDLHGNFFINEGDANKKDFIEFIDGVQLYLERNYGIPFEIEVKTE